MLHRLLIYMVVHPELVRLRAIDGAVGSTT